MERIVRIQQGQATVPFQRYAEKFGSVKQNSFSIIYQDDEGHERSLDVIAQTNEVFRYWYDGLNSVLKEIEYFQKHSTLDERFLKHKFQLADEDRSGNLSRKEVVQLIASMNIDMKPALVNSMFDLVDTDKSNNLDFNEFAQFIRILRRR